MVESFHNGLNESLPIFTDIFSLARCCSHEHFFNNYKNQKMTSSVIFPFTSPVIIGLGNHLMQICVS